MDLQLNPTVFPEGESHFKIEGPSGDLEVCTSKSQNARDVIAIICHPHPLHQGTMHNKVVYSLSRAFLQCGVSSIRFNYRGVGLSQGVFGDSIGEVEDLCAIINWRKKVAPEASLILAGFSFGCYIAAKGSTLYPCRQLFTIAPSVLNQPFDSLEIDVPLVVVQGEKDEIIDAQAVYQWFESLKAPSKQLIKMPDTTHFFSWKINGSSTSH